MDLRYRCLITKHLKQFFLCSWSMICSLTLTEFGLAVVMLLPPQKMMSLVPLPDLYVESNMSAVIESHTGFTLYRCGIYHSISSAKYRCYPGPWSCGFWILGSARPSIPMPDQRSRSQPLHTKGSVSPVQEIALHLSYCRGDGF